MIDNKSIQSQTFGGLLCKRTLNKLRMGKSSAKFQIFRQLFVRIQEVRERPPIYLISDNEIFSFFAV